MARPIRLFRSMRWSRISTPTLMPMTTAFSVGIRTPCTSITDENTEGTLLEAVPKIISAA